MSTKISLICIFGLFISSVAESKGLFSGVPCHRPYSCFNETESDGFENSILLGTKENVEEEKQCQELCSAMEECISYSWWNEKNQVNSNGRNPFLCELFALCHRNYHNPSLTPVFSGTHQYYNIGMLVDFGPFTLAIVVIPVHI